MMVALPSYFLSASEYKETKHCSSTMIIWKYIYRVLFHSLISKQLQYVIM